MNLNLRFDAPVGVFHTFQVVRRNGEILGQAVTVSNIVSVADSEIGLFSGTAGPYFGSSALATISGAVHYTPKATPSLDLEVRNIGSVPFGSVVFVSIQVDDGPPIVETIGGAGKVDCPSVRI